MTSMPTQLRRNHRRRDATVLTAAPSPAVVARAYGPRDAAVRRALAAADLTAVLAALGVALAWGAHDARAFALAIAALPAWTVVFKAYGLYERDIKRFSRGVLYDLPAVVHAVLIGTGGLWLYLQLTPADRVPTGRFALFAGCAICAILAARAATRRVVARTLGPERALIIGDSAAIPRLVRKLSTHREYGVLPIGVVTRAPAARIDRLPIVGRPDTLDLAAIVERHGIQRVILAELEAGLEVPELVRHAHQLGVKVGFLPHAHDALGAAVEVDDVEGTTVFALYPPVLCRSSRAVKRLMDVVGGGALLAVAAPLMLVIAVAVKLDSPGPALFWQDRIGRGGRRFRLAKFRTMVPDAEAMVPDLLAGSADPHWLLLDRDPRVTRLGRMLRRTSLDELPQLWNVLRGDMSLVGPRPLIESEDRQITGWGRGRLDLTPGLTGLWQVLGRTSIPFEEMVTLDYIYVTQWSLWRDIQLLLRTLPVLVSLRGAN
jgi:exopolysaccharide biosynthesis polyprenyl glycosylphosphotransferase